MLDEGLIKDAPFYSISLRKDLEEIFPLEELNAERIKFFIIRNSEELWKQDNAVGGWVYENNVYLDVVTLFAKHLTTLEQLKEVAAIGKQIAAYDLELNKTITF
jgi:hypothetical protein